MSIAVARRVGIFSCGTRGHVAEHEDSLVHLRSDAADWERMLARPDVVVLLALEGDNPIGYASTTRRINLWTATDTLALDDLWVRESARNQGVGSLLMAGVAGLADEQTFVWGARRENEDGHRFYRRLGATLNTDGVASGEPAAYDWAVSV